jgi:hypothetical protein
VVIWGHLESSGAIWRFLGRGTWYHLGTSTDIRSNPGSTLERLPALVKQLHRRITPCDRLGTPGIIWNHLEITRPASRQATENRKEIMWKSKGNRVSRPAGRWRGNRMEIESASQPANGNQVETDANLGVAPPPGTPLVTHSSFWR